MIILSIIGCYYLLKFNFSLKNEVNDDDAEILTKRERAVLELVARGFSYGEIAKQQAVSIHTVQTHIKNIYHKLAVHSKVDAVREATRMGLLPRAQGSRER